MAAVTVHLHDSSGMTHHVSGRSGQSLMKAAVAAGIDGIAADCGGCLTCATCHVIVAPDWAARLPAPSADEQSMLEMTAVPAEPTSRLSCQIVLTPELSGFSARLPATQY